MKQHVSQPQRHQDFTTWLYVCHCHWVWLLTVSTYNKNIGLCVAGKTSVPILVKAYINCWFSLLSEGFEFTLWLKHACSKMSLKVPRFYFIVRLSSATLDKQANRCAVVSTVRKSRLNLILIPFPFNKTLFKNVGISSQNRTSLFNIQLHVSVSVL